MQIDRITHRCKDFEGQEKDVASGEKQEIRSGVSEDLFEKGQYTVNKGRTSGMAFCGIYDYNQGQHIFDAEGIGVGGWTVESRKSVPYASESTA